MSFLIPNPCKKCVVRACCRKICEDFYYYYIDRYKFIKWLMVTIGFIICFSIAMIILLTHGGFYSVFAGVGVSIIIIMLIQIINPISQRKILKKFPYEEIYKAGIFNETDDFM